MNLNYHQFYHVAPQSARESIDRNGIDFRQGNPVWEENASGPGNFLWTTRKDASIYQHMASQLTRSPDVENWLDDSGQTYDVYEVTLPNRKLSGIPVKKDPEFVNGRKTSKPIPRRFVRRIG